MKFDFPILNRYIYKADSIYVNNLKTHYLDIPMYVGGVVQGAGVPGLGGHEGDP